MPKPPPLDPDRLIAKAAELRATGSSWKATAEDLGQDVDDLKLMANDDRPAWRRLVGMARREMIEDAFAEAVFVLRTDVRSKDNKSAREAANMLVKLWMTLVRHRARRPAAKGQGRPGAETHKMERRLSGTESREQTPARVRRLPRATLRRGPRGTSRNEDSKAERG